MNRFAAIVVAAASLALAGCAQRATKHAVDVEFGSHIHTVLVAQAPNQESFTTLRDWFIPPGGLGLIFLLGAVADTQISTSRVTDAVDVKQTRLQDRFSEMLRDGLLAQGYESRTLVLPDVGDPDQFLSFLQHHGPADAALVVMLRGSVGGSGTSAVPTAQFFPLLSVTATVFNLGTGAVLYADRFAYGRADPLGGAVYVPGDPKYGFASVGDMVADPVRLREGWFAGMRLIADKILADLQHKPAAN